MVNRDRLVGYTKALLNKPHLVFLVIATVFGLLFIFTLAPLNGTDEFTHFPRVYQISQGTFWPQELSKSTFGGYLPVNVNNMINDYRNLSRMSPGSGYLKAKDELNREYRSVSNPGTKLSPAVFTSILQYPPWAYIPSLIGLIVAKALHLPLIWYVYLARISTLFVWIGLGFLAIKLLPSGKWFLLALGLLPTSLSQAATIGGDGIVMALSWLAIAMVLGIIAKKINPDWSKLAALGLISIYVAVIKDGYFLLGLLPLAIPSRTFKSKRTAYAFKTGLAVSVALVATLFTIRTVHALNGVDLTPTVGMNINNHDQISYIIHHAFSYGSHILIQPFTKSFDTTYQGIVGIITNRLIYLSILIMGLLYFGLYLGLRTTNQVIEIYKSKKQVLVVFLGIFLLSYCLLATALYIGDTSVGASYVNVIYGRYFLPLLPLLLVIPMSTQRNTKIKSWVYRPVICLISITGLLATIMSLK